MKTTNQSKLITALALTLISGSALAEAVTAGPEGPNQRPLAATPEPAKPDMNLIGAALQALSQAGDQEAIDAMDKARKNGGKLELTQEEAAKMITRAQDKGLLKKGTSGTNQIGEALKALVAAGDPDAIAANNKAAANGGRLQLTPEEARTFIDRAKAKGLIKEGGGDPEAEMKAKLGKAIQALAEAGDEEAAAELKKARENGGKLQITREKGLELVKRAIDKGLIE